MLELTVYIVYTVTVQLVAHAELAKQISVV